MAQKDLKRVRAAAKRLEVSRAWLRDAVLRAQRSGESVRDIAPWAGMSSTAVQRLLDEAKRLEREQQQQ